MYGLVTHALPGVAPGCVVPGGFEAGGPTLEHFHFK